MTSEGNHKQTFGSEDNVRERRVCNIQMELQLILLVRISMLHIPPILTSKSLTMMVISGQVLGSNDHDNDNNKGEKEIDDDNDNRQ